MLLKRLLYVIAASWLAAGMVLLIVSLRDGGGEKEPLAIGVPLPTLVPTATATAATTTASETPEPTQGPQGDPRLAALDINRVVIPAIGVDAPIVVLGVHPDGTMASPAGPDAVA